MAHKSHHARRRLIVAERNLTQRSFRSNEQQLALIATRPGNSTKEKARLTK